MKTDCIKGILKSSKKYKNSSMWWFCSFLQENAKQMQADVFISADFKYHEFFDAENDLVIADTVDIMKANN